MQSGPSICQARVGLRLGPRSKSNTLTTPASKSDYQNDPRMSTCRHTRVIRVSVDCAYSPENAHHFIRSWTLRTLFSEDNYLLLHKKQRKMRYLHVVGLETGRPQENAVHAKMEAQDSIFTSCSTLGLYPARRSDMKICNLFLRKAKSAKRLTIYPQTQDYDRRSLRELHDSAASHGLLSKTLFAHMLPFEECTPLAHVTNLTLQDVHLRHCAQSYCRLFDVTMSTISR